MGLLSAGTSLTWEETAEVADHIRDAGIIQLINLFNRVKDRKNDILKWGDEIEYCLVHLDHKNKDARLSLVAPEVLKMLQHPENNDPDNIDSLWRPEYANYMIEGTPGKPFCCTLCRLRFIETSMYLRRMEAKRVLEKYDSVKLVNYASFPRMGCVDFTEPNIKIDDLDKNGISRSLFYPDEAIFSAHPRFRNLTRNIRSRRGEKPKIYVPIWKDKNTPSVFVEPIPEGVDDGEGAAGVKPDHLYMDTMGFGMGCCCLQITMQACNIDEARYIYDQMVPLAPLLMTLSAASPIWKGYLADYDCRWTVISGSVDDRTKSERELQEDGFSAIPKSRYDTVDMYLHPKNKDLNDIRVEYDKKYYNQLIEAGFDEQLAKHFAHLFIRDPISVFKEKLEINNEEETDHFENLQSTNWQSVRFKPPPPKSTIGWRVEFRTLEIQLCDFVNAAYVTFVMLLTRIMLTNKLDMTMPISQVDINMRNAIKKDAVKNGLFYFCKTVSEHNSLNNFETELMSMDTIINGGEAFVGLIPLIKEYLDTSRLCIETRWHINRVFNIVGNVASGKFMTPAAWIRDFVTNHPLYKQDSYVSKEIAYDLTVEIDKMSNGLTGNPKMFGDNKQQAITNKFIDDYREMLKCQTHYISDEGSNK